MRSCLSPAHLLLLDFVTYADIDDNEISDCGIKDFVINDGEKEKNGEGICEYHRYDASYDSNIEILPREAANLGNIYILVYINRGDLQQRIPSKHA